MPPETVDVIQFRFWNMIRRLSPLCYQLILNGFDMEPNGALLASEAIGNCRVRSLMPNTGRGIFLYWKIIIY